MVSLCDTPVTEPPTRRDHVVQIHGSAAGLDCAGHARAKVLGGLSLLRWSVRHAARQGVGSGALRLKWPLLCGALGRNIHRKETRKPSDKHKANPARKTIFLAREPYSATLKSSTTRLWTTPTAVAPTKFRPLSEPHPATKTYYERMTATAIPPSAERPPWN